MPNPRTREEWDKWAAKCRAGQVEAQKRAYKKLGVDRKKLFDRSAKKQEQKGKKREAVKGTVSSNMPDNHHGLVCTECWAQPETLRTNGLSMPRHLPVMKGASLYRDTEFCAGQGRQGVVVLDDSWEPGSKPNKTVPGKKWINGEVRA